MFKVMANLVNDYPNNSTLKSKEPLEISRCSNFFYWCLPFNINTFINVTLVGASLATSIKGSTKQQRSFSRRDVKTLNYRHTSPPIFTQYISNYWFFGNMKEAF